MDIINRKLVSVECLRTGDTVEIDGRFETVGRHHLKRGFMGSTYKGSRHHKGIILVTFPAASGLITTKKEENSKAS